MKFLLLGDIVENKEALEKFSNLDFRNYDFVLFTGDVLSFITFKKLREERVVAGEISEDAQERKSYLKETIEDKDILKKDFVKKYDVLIFVDASDSVIESGKPPKRYERW